MAIRLPLNQELIEQLALEAILAEVRERIAAMAPEDIVADQAEAVAAKAKELGVDRVTDNDQKRIAAAIDDVAVTVTASFR